MPRSDEAAARHWLQYAKFLVIAFAAGSLLLFYYQTIRNIVRFEEIDLTSYIRASTWFFAGDNPYQDVARRYIYPQFLLIVVYPFHWLMDAAATKRLVAGIWSAGLITAFFFAVSASWRYLKDADTLRSALRKNVTVTAILVVMVHPMLQDEFLNGQVNLFILGSLVAFFICVERKRDLLAAVFLAVAASIKIAPALCLLYPLIVRRYRPVVYFVPLTLLFSVILPIAMNGQSLQYYSYFGTEVVPRLAAADIEHGFRSFSIISTISHLADIQWHPAVKLAVTGLLTGALLVPIYALSVSRLQPEDRMTRFVTFAAIMSVIPLTFPMSEAHHLLLLIVPCIAIVQYIRDRINREGTGPVIDRLSIALVISIVGLHVGHAFKDTPIRLLSLIGVYVGLLVLLARTGASTQTLAIDMEDEGQPVRMSSESPS